MRDAESQAANLQSGDGVDRYGAGRYVSVLSQHVGFVLGPPLQAATSVDTAGLTSAKFHIEGMTCEGCANILHGALTKLPDVNAAEVDFAAKTALVRYKPDKPVPPERVIEAVKAVG